MNPVVVNKDYSKQITWKIHPLAFNLQEIIKNDKRKFIERLARKIENQIAVGTRYLRYYKHHMKTNYYIC